MIPTLLELLREGCDIVFPSGLYLKGLPSTGHIEVGDSTGGSGWYFLTEKGIIEALTYLKKVSEGEPESRKGGKK